VLININTTRGARSGCIRTRLYSDSLKKDNTQERSFLFFKKRKKIHPHPATSASVLRRPPLPPTPISCELLLDSREAPPAAADQRRRRSEAPSLPPGVGAAAGDGWRRGARLRPEERRVQEEGLVRRERAWPRWRRVQEVLRLHLPGALIVRTRCRRRLVSSSFHLLLCISCCCLYGVV
jgi:hypothetical protein